MRREEWYGFIKLLLEELARDGYVTRTFRRLDYDRQTAIIDALFDEAVENGPEDLNVKRVAERAEISVGSLYQYFGSREGVMNFAIELVVRTTKVTFEAVRPYLAALPLREALLAYGNGGMEWAGAQSGFVGFFARAAYGGDRALAERVVQPVAAIMLDMVRDIVNAAHARGEIRDDLDLEATARALNALIIALYDPLLLPYLNIYFQVSGEGVSQERTLNAAIDMVLKGIEKQ